FYDGVQNSFDRIIGSVSEDFQKELTEGFELAKNRRVTAAKIRDAVFDPKTGHMTHSTISQELEGADRAVEIAKLFGVEKPNRKHIENIVRKYSDDAVGIGKPDNAEVIAKVGKIDNEGDIAEVVTELPRKDLPDYASNRVKEEAERLLSELYSGSGPGFSAGGQLEGGGEGFGSTNVSWYRELYKQGMGKKQVDAALNRIIQNAGKDKGVQVERVKDLIVDTFTFGDDASGIPPDLGVLKSLGAPDSVMDDALKAFNGIAGETMSMDDALRASGYVEEATAIAKKVNIDDLTDDEIIKILTNRAESKGVSADEIAKITDGIAGEKLLPPMVGNPTYARAIYESMDGFKRGIGEFKKFAVDNWQQQIPALSDDLEKVLANAPK
ncbi:MAG: hypothetical protein GY755_25700, partial [Chloroflexi bacterium]|nr:hypothetical protein [Chloroflexota bacterium]